MELKNIIILGTGGNCIDILDTINEINLIKPTYEVIGFLDDDKNSWGNKIYGIEILGSLDSALNYEDTYFVNGIGSPNNFWEKDKIIAKTKLSIDRFATIIHPTASVSKFAKIGRGTVILQNTTVASNVTIGDHVIILPNCVINHDDVIDNYVSLASGVCVAGNVKIKKSSYIGSGSIIIGNVIIEQDALVGMGSVVLKDKKEKSVVIGNPAKYLRSVY